MLLSFTIFYNVIFTARTGTNLHVLLFPPENRVNVRRGKVKGRKEKMETRRMMKATKVRFYFLYLGDR